MGIRRRLLYLGLCLVLLPGGASGRVERAGQDTVGVVILHVNDTHGRLLPFDTPEQKEVGGFARLATLVREIRRENEGRTLLLHAGDIFSRGGALTVSSGGEADFRAMDRVGFDALTPGNGDFYWGLENLMQQASLARFPLTHANVVYRKTGGSLFSPYVILEAAGVRVAALGLGWIDENHPASRPLALQDAVAAARRYAPILREKADLVLALTHVGIRADSVLAMAVPQIDVIVGGHSHTRLDAPVRIPKAGGEGEVIIVQAGDYGQFLGRLDVRLRRTGSGFRVVGAEGRLIPVNGRIPDDPEVAALLKSYEGRLEEVLCVSETALANPPSGDSPLGRLVTGALRAETGTEVVLLDRGAVRGDLKPGRVTVADVYRVHPWRNRVLRLSLTGAQIRRVLEERDVLTAGCRFRRDGKAVEGLEVSGAPVDTARSYAVAAGEFLVGYSSLRDLPFDETGRRVDAVLCHYLRRLSVIRE